MERVAVTWRENYIAVDWGTTNRRAWLIGEDGAIVEEFADQCGLIAVPENGFGEAVAEIRERLGQWPMLLGGMVGSDRGWRNVPYVRCPTGVKTLAQSIMWIDPYFTGIMPGVSQIEGHADVMRGEEVQALGALSGGLVSPDALLCHPGTHTKWIRLKGGQIVEFRTVMTGEIFDLLRNNSLLAAQMQAKVADGASFQAGLDQVFKGASPLASLFTIRAQHLLLPDAVEGASFASGVLIGSDAAAGLKWASEHATVAVVGRADLCQLYAKAIAYAGFESNIIDGNQAFLSGIRAIASHLEAGLDH